jgi:hypothetical protein
VKKRNLITFTNIHRSYLETIDDTINRYQDFLDLLNSVAYHRAGLITEITDQDLADAGFDISRSYVTTSRVQSTHLIRFIDSPLPRK